MARRPGPPPKEPKARVRRNRDEQLAPASSAQTATPPSKAPTKPTAAGSRKTRQTPVVDGDGWTSIPPGARTAAAPRLPDWLNVGGDTEQVYQELAKLPQAKAWLESEWKLLQLALPLLERYLSRPGSESFKALVSSLSPALKLTTDDLAKARMRIAYAVAADAGAASEGVVTDITSRRRRLTG